MTQKSLSDDFIEVMAAIRAATPQGNSDPARHIRRAACDAALRAIANGVSTAWGVLGVLDAQIERASDPTGAVHSE